MTLSAEVHLGTKNCDFQMERYVFKRRNDGNATTPKKRKSNLSTAIRVNYGSRAANLGQRKVSNAGRRQQCDFFEADGSEGSNTYVLETCMTAIKYEDNPLVVCTLFASALAAYYSSMKQQVKDTLTDIGADLRIIYLPDQANESGIEANDQYDVCDANVIMGACVCILFKNISDKSYYKFISNRLHALAGMLGMSKTRLATLTQVQPVTITQAKYIREKLGSDNNLKKEMLLYLMELTDDGGHVQSASRYLCMILSWNEMTPFTFVHEKLCLTGSPVLNQDSVRHEVIKFAEAASAVARSRYPQFFRYFCSRDEEELVQRSRFPVLAAVAHRLKNIELTSSTTRNFVGTLPEEEEGLVQELVELHNAFLATATMGPDEAVDFLTRDPEVLGYESYDEEDES